MNESQLFEIKDTMVPASDGESYFKKVMPYSLKSITRGIVKTEFSFVPDRLHRV